MSLQTVMVTGANRGIGLELVRQLLAEPNPPQHLIATTRAKANRAELDALAVKHPNLHVIDMESKDYNSFTAYTPTGVVAQVQQIVGSSGLDTLINNAGVLIPKLLDTVTANDMIENFEINTVSPLMLTKALLPLLKIASVHRKTAVVNISSSLGSIELAKPRPNGQWFSIFPYRCSKAALNMISQCLSTDLKRDNIYVISMNPGHLKTDLGGPTAQIEVADGVNELAKPIPDDQWFSVYAYRCSKAALNMISQCLSTDLKRDNIYAISMNPGHLKTDLGGPTAQIEVSDGVNGVIKQIKLIDDNSNGKLVTYAGGVLPW
ncbi:uncharacterized protein LOC128963752 [Oppia nitens]|uniref:uncharacterized protein LOC128963752 n=1 Tax=Oppia nitens TaxID=1686743 RepID=UPI0023D9B7FE|nr:uncharacterized protein LOC128963752 [Oppia nitens]